MEYAYILISYIVIFEYFIEILSHKNFNYFLQFSIPYSYFIIFLCIYIFMFILCFSLEPECLGVLLSQLVVTLSLLIDDYPKIITEALNYLIIEHRYHLIFCVLYLLDL